MPRKQSANVWDCQFTETQRKPKRSTPLRCLADVIENTDIIQFLESIQTDQTVERNSWIWITIIQSIGLSDPERHEPPVNNCGRSAVACHGINVSMWFLSFKSTLIAVPLAASDVFIEMTAGNGIPVWKSKIHWPISDLCVESASFIIKTNRKCRKSTSFKVNNEILHITSLFLARYTRLI